jgi:hypothetical protein
MFDFNPKTGKGSGHFLTPRGGDVPFLPEEPANSPPFDLVVTAEPELDPELSPDGHTHYLIGGDPEVVKLIVAFYEASGHPVPAGYEQAAADHAAAVQAAADKAAADKKAAADAAAANKAKP